MQVQEAVRSALIDWVHDVGIDVTKGQADKLAKLVEEKFTSTNKPSAEMCPDCEGSGCEDFDGETPIKCSTCNGVGHTSHVG